MGWKVMFAVMNTLITDDTTKRKPKQSGEPKQHAIAKAVLTGLAMHAHDDGGGAYASRERIAHVTGLSVHSVQNGLEWLVRHGYVVVDETPERVVRRWRAANGPGRPPVTYRICLDMLWPDVVSPSRHAPPPSAPPSSPSRPTAEYSSPDALYSFSSPDALYSFSASDALYSGEFSSCDGEFSASHELESLESSREDSREERDADAEADAETWRAWCAPLPPAGKAKGLTTSAGEDVTNTLGVGDDTWCVVVDGDDVDRGGDGGIDIGAVRRAHAMDAQVVAALAHRTWQQRADALSDVYEQRWWTVAEEQRAACHAAEEAAEAEGEDDAISEQRDIALMAARYRACRLPYIHIRRRRRERWHQHALAQQQHHAPDAAVDAAVDAAGAVDESEYLTA